jgi:hypothetical protein
MRNVRSRQCLLFVLVGLACLITVFIGRAGGPALALPAQAASQAISNSHRACNTGPMGPSFGGDVVISNNEVECGDLTTFGGTVVISGEVRGAIAAFNSMVDVAGVVDGDINLYGGSIVVQDGSQIHGDVHLYGGKWVEGHHVQLNGTVKDETKQVDWLFPNVEHFSFSFWSLLIWVALGMLLTSLFPEHVMLVRTTAVSKMRRSSMIGLLSVVLAPPVLIVLIALVVSIPLAIIVGLGLIAAWGMGTVAVGWQIGDYILQRIAPHRNTRMGQIATGLAVLVLVGSLPYIGWLISIGVGMLGLGAVLLSRFGTRLFGQPREPLPL